jgi:hypothetical protein
MIAFILLFFYFRVCLSCSRKIPASATTSPTRPANTSALSRCRFNKSSFRLSSWTFSILQHRSKSHMYKKTTNMQGLNTLICGTKKQKFQHFFGFFPVNNTRNWFTKPTPGDRHLHLRRRPLPRQQLLLRRRRREQLRDRLHVHQQLG